MLTPVSGPLRRTLAMAMRSHECVEGFRSPASAASQAVSALGEILDPDMLDDMMSRAADLVEMDGGRLTLQSFQELVHFYCA